jgi:superfamily I DNA/RNA helicase
MNRAQLTLARHALHDYGRFFAVGDRKQAIYGWNGADASGMDKMKSLFNAKEFKLPISYRAPEAVAKLVRDTYIPDFEARPGAPDGLVKLVDVAFMRKTWAPGDMYISRKNAPLPKACLMALSDGIPAYIKGGRDITKHLFALLKKSRQSGTAEFLKWLSEHVERQLLLLSAAKQEKAMEDLLDTKATLVALAEDTEAVHEIEGRLNRLFADDSPGGRLMCATAFKAKGLETEPGRAVWLDWPSFRDNSAEECNIRYVAETRTQHALYMVVNKLGGGS